MITPQGKVYLGDGVYSTLDDGRLVLTTENGIKATNTIVLEGPVLEALLNWLERKHVLTWTPQSE